MVILNVLKNSTESIDIQGGAKMIAIRVHAPADLLVLEVRDTGTGFNGTIADQLFKQGCVEACA